MAPFQREGWGHFNLNGKGMACREWWIETHEYIKDGPSQTQLIHFGWTENFPVNYSSWWNKSCIWTTHYTTKWSGFDTSISFSEMMHKKDTHISGLLSSTLCAAHDLLMHGRRKARKWGKKNAWTKEGRAGFGQTPTGLGSLIGSWQAGTEMRGKSVTKLMFRGTLTGFLGFWRMDHAYGI